MDSSISFPIIFLILKKPNIIGTKLSNPNLQSKVNKSTSIAIGVTIAPAKSGNICAKSVSVLAELSSITRLILPLPFLSK